MNTSKEREVNKMYEVSWDFNDGYESGTDGHFLFNSLESAFHGMEVVFNHFRKDIEKYPMGDSFEMGEVQKWNGNFARVTFTGQHENYEIILSEVEIYGSDFDWEDWD